MTNITKQLEWACEIWNSIDGTRVTGRITFSPGKGIKIKVVNIDGMIRGKSELLYGILESGELFTAIEANVPSRSGVVMRNGYTSYPATITPKSILVGSHITVDQSFQDVRFALHGMQEYFYAKYEADEIEFKKEPLFEINTSYGALSLECFATYKSAPDNLSTFIKTLGETKNKELSDDLTHLSKKYESSGFNYRTEFGYKFRLKSDNDHDANSVYECIDNIADLFSLLANSPVLIDSIEIILERGQGKAPARNYLIPSFVMNESTYQKALNYPEHSILPITNKNICLANVIDSWYKNRDSLQVMSSAVRHDIGTASTHQTYSTLLMLAVHLEQISMEEGANGNTKYEYPISNYASDNVKKHLIKLLSLRPEESMGEIIGDIRNELAHVMKPKKALLKYSNRELSKIGQLLEIIVVSWIFEKKLGIARNVCLAYQDHHWA